jgi:glycosyltransferase involved in cell wall biosynthesis
MNIVHELNQLDYGGVEKVIRNIIKYDTKNKHTVIAYKDGPFKKELEAVGGTVQGATEDQKETEFEADVIHVHTGGGLSEMAISLGRQFPVIETIHSPVRSMIPPEFVRQRVGVTEAVARMNADCITIHNGIDFSSMQITRSKEDIKKELGIRENVPVVGRLGRVGKDKCLEEWLLACYYLQKRGLEFIPLIVGGEASGLNGYVGKLKLMAESLPVKGVVWAGHKDDVANYLQVMDVFLYPSPTEGFGMVFVEAMHCESVVVTYDNDVSREIAGGFAVLETNSIEGLINGVIKALDISVRDAIIPLAQSWVQDQFDAERMSEDYQELYEKILSENMRKSDNERTN